jgi:hypothetical protein
MSDNAKYINGLFIKEEEGQYGPYITVGITEDGLAALEALPMNAKGVRNLFLSRQKTDTSKFSAIPAKSKSESNSGGGNKRQPIRNTRGKVVEESGDGDKLPWD